MNIKYVHDLNNVDGIKYSNTSKMNEIFQVSFLRAQCQKFLLSLDKDDKKSKDEIQKVNSNPDRYLLFGEIVLNEAHQKSTGATKTQSYKLKQMGCKLILKKDDVDKRIQFLVNAGLDYEAQQEIMKQKDPMQWVRDLQI